MTISNCSQLPLNVHRTKAFQGAESQPKWLYNSAIFEKMACPLSKHVWVSDGDPCPIPCYNITKNQISASRFWSFFGQKKPEMHLLPALPCVETSLIWVTLPSLIKVSVLACQFWHVLGRPNLTFAICLVFRAPTFLNHFSPARKIQKAYFRAHFPQQNLWGWKLVHFLTNCQNFS